MKHLLRSNISYSIMVAVLVFATVVTVASAQTITTFDPPNSISTVAQAINVSGQIAGYYRDANGTQNGFLREQDGTFILFKADASVAQRPTLVTDINSSGEIIGYIYRPEGGFPGFIRNTDGNIVLFTGSQTSTNSLALATEPAPFPCSGMDNCVDGTGPMAVNEFGQITGTYGAGFYLGFLRQPDGTTIEFNANPTGLPFTIPQGMNASGEITGYYKDSNSGAHGFLRKSDGTITTFDPTGSVATHPAAINLKGEITGSYTTPDGTQHGFVRTCNGKFFTFDPVNSVATQATAINRKGQVIGFYATADGTYHGFLRGRNGAMNIFDIPGGTGGTFPKDIDDLGQIVGYYQDAAFVLHGFLRSAR